MVANDVPSPKLRSRRVGRRIVLAIFCACLAWILVSNILVSRAVAGHVYSSAGKIPHHRVGIVLGTSPFYGPDPNVFFNVRLDAAAELYRAGKVEKLLVSGDGGANGENETEAMRQNLLQRGIPAFAIVKDDHGYRTLDTVVRAKQVFGLDDCAFITDDYHLPRTLFLASNHGLNADGFASRHVAVRSSLLTHIREVGARALVVLDVLLGRGPKVLGPRISI